MYAPRERAGGILSDRSWAIPLAGAITYSLLVTDDRWFQLSDVTRGLIYLRGLGIIHGDLKAACFEPHVDSLPYA